MIKVIGVLFCFGLVYLIMQRIKNPPLKKNACQKCEGKGYWLGARGREQCDICKGSGIK